MHICEDVVYLPSELEDYVHLASKESERLGFSSFPSSSSSSLIYQFWVPFSRSIKGHSLFICKCKNGIRNGEAVLED